MVIALSPAPRKPRASQVDPNAISFGASEVDPNAISLPPGHGNPKPRIGRHPADSAANSDPKTLQNPGTLKSWSITTMFLLFGRGIVLFCGDTQSFIPELSAIQFTYNIPSLASCVSLTFVIFPHAISAAFEVVNTVAPRNASCFCFVCNTLSKRLSNSAKIGSNSCLYWYADFLYHFRSQQICQFGNEKRHRPGCKVSEG